MSYDQQRQKHAAPDSSKSAPHWLFREQRRERILKAAEQQFAATGFGSTSPAAIAKAARIPEAALFVYFGTRQELFREVLERNSRRRQAGLEERFLSIPNLPPLKRFTWMAESTVLACVGEVGNASLIVWGLMEMPESATEIYRDEIGANEALWNSAIETFLAESDLRTGVAVRLVPYGVHACMAFGLWLATLHHTPATAQAHARQYADGIVHVARAVLNLPPDPL